MNKFFGSGVTALLLTLAPQRIIDEDNESSVFPLTLNREKPNVISAKELFEK